MKDLKNYSLKAHNTFGIDAKCSRFLEFEDEQEAIEVAKILRDSDSPLYYNRWWQQSVADERLRGYRGAFRHQGPLLRRRQQDGLW